MTTAPTEPLRPKDTAELSKLLAGMYASATPVEVRGGNTKAWGHHSAHATALDTTGISGIVEHSAADQTVRVGCGTRFSDLQAQLASAGQRVALDPPDRGGTATVGGVLASGDHGPLRQRYGAGRELVIGATFVLADGTVAKSGGQVIKNVAGLDLAKLLCGSLGTLGILSEVVLRVHPLPQASATLTMKADAELATAAALTAGRSVAEPCAIEWDGEAMLFGFEGAAEGMAMRAEGLKADLQAAGLGAGDLGELSPAAAETAWGRLARSREAPAGGICIRMAALPSRLAELSAAAQKAAEIAGAEVALFSHAGLGLTDVVATANEGGSVQELLSQLRRLCSKVATSVVVRDRGWQGEPEIDLWGPRPDAASVMAAVKRSLDPKGILAPGRFAPWW